MNEKLLWLIKFLLSENDKYKDIEIPDDKNERFRLFRGLVNLRAPKPVSEEFLAIQDEYLQGEIAAKGVTDIADLTPITDSIYLWQGDITTLKCGAVVNAANSALLGCFCPNHGCIDNAIHTFAGVQLRLECAKIMRDQGFDEPTGQAKITPAFNLPCEYVLHTVGPIVDGALNEKHEQQLADCYRSCLELSKQNGIKSVAFCCISTGEFRFPNERAAETAVQTVRDFLRNNSDIEVIFNVLKDEDYEIYKRILKAN